MTQAKVNVNRPDAANEELVDVLTAISVVSMRLARKLTMLAVRSQSEEGEKENEQNQRYGRDHRRAAQCCCSD